MEEYQYSKQEKQERLLRLKEVLKIVPVSKSTWWAGVKSGRFPTPVKLGPRVTAWQSDSIIPIIEQGV